MWKHCVALAGLIVAMASSPAAVAENMADPARTERVHQVVMHLNSGDENVQRSVVNNIRHLYQAVGREQLKLELVVHGAGLSLLMKQTTLLGPELAHLKAGYGVYVTACSNTMKAMKVTREDLIDEVGDTVPAMVRLMERQEQGWAYIKP